MKVFKDKKQWRKELSEVCFVFPLLLMLVATPISDAYIFIFLYSLLLIVPIIFGTWVLRIAAAIILVCVAGYFFTETNRRQKMAPLILEKMLKDQERLYRQE